MTKKKWLGFTLVISIFLAFNALIGSLTVPVEDQVKGALTGLAVGVGLLLFVFGFYLLLSEE